MDEIVCNYGYITECMYICKKLLMQLIKNLHHSITK